MDNGHITGIILAAGKASRYGQDKRLVEINGEAMLLQAAKKLKRHLADTIVVIRDNDQEIQTLLTRHNITTVICPEAKHGMGHSLACAVNARPNAHAWLIALADMPYIATTTYENIIGTMRQGASICTPLHQGQRGHPVAFSQEYKDELLSLTGDTGARELLQRHKNKLTKLELDDPGILIDIDAPTNLATVS